MLVVNNMKNKNIFRIGNKTKPKKYMRKCKPKKNKKKKFSEN